MLVSHTTRQSIKQCIPIIRTCIIYIPRSSLCLSHCIHTSSPPHVSSHTLTTTTIPSHDSSPIRSIFGLSSSSPPLINHTITRSSRHPISLLSAIILDVDAYHTYLPFCTESRILTRAQNEYTATLTIGFRIFTETYTSHITYTTTSTSCTIRIKAINSNLFKHLISTWILENRNGMTTSTFHIEFSVYSRLHATAVQMFFEQVAQQQMDAFEKRADEMNAKGIIPSIGIPIQTAAATATSTPTTVRSSTPPVTPSSPFTRPPPRPIRTCHALPDIYISSYWSDTELNQLRTLFRTHAHTYRIQVHSSHGIPREMNECGDEYRIDRNGFAAICMHLQNKSPDHPLVRFRERYVIKALCSESCLLDWVWNHLFLRLPATEPAPLLTPDDSMMDTDTSTSTSTQITSPSSATSSLSTVSFPTFISHLHYITRADDMQRLEFVLYQLICAYREEMMERESPDNPVLAYAFEYEYDIKEAPTSSSRIQRTGGGEHSYGNDDIDTSSHSSSTSSPSFHDIAIPLSLLHTWTWHYLAFQLSVIRYVMPGMVVAHVRTLESIPPVDRGVHTLAMLGVMDSVLSETELAIHDTLRIVTQQFTSPITSDPSVSLATWCASFQSHADLLSVMSVMGMSSLINWASITNTQKRSSSTDPTPTPNHAGRH